MFIMSLPTILWLQLMYLADPFYKLLEIFLNSSTASTDILPQYDSVGVDQCNWGEQIWSVDYLLVVLHVHDPAQAQPGMYSSHLPRSYCCADFVTGCRVQQDSNYMDSSSGMATWHLIAKCSFLTRALFQMLFLKRHIIFCCRWHGLQNPSGLTVILLRRLPGSHEGPFPPDTSNTRESSIIWQKWLDCLHCC